MLDLISKPRLRLELVGTKNEDESLALQDYQLGLAKALSLCISHHLGYQVTLAPRCTSIESENFDKLRVSDKGS